MNKAKIIVATAVVYDESRKEIGALALGAQVYVFFTTVDGFAYVNAVSEDDATAGYVGYADIQMEAAPTDGGGSKYTNESNEVLAKSTPFDSADLVAAIGRDWEGLGLVGAKSLVAQHLFETGGGRACFNWNIGNFKSDAATSHFYLKDVWECVSRSTAEIDMAKSPPQVCREATVAELVKPRIACGGGAVSMIYNPPSYMARFRAFVTLDEGTHFWCDYFRKDHPAMIEPMRTGDMPALAHAMKQAGYFSGDEADYANGMQRYFKEL